MRNLKSKIKSSQAGFTYVELIVVLGIFVIMTSVVIYNYGGFEAKVDIKNLGSDVALQVVQAQKNSISGLLPPSAQQALIASPSTWKPAYGVYFNIGSGGDNKSFIYFTDLNNDGLYTNVNCLGVGECLNKISITKGDYISSLSVLYQGDPTPHPLNDLTITFKRPNSSPTITSSTTFTSAVSYVQITVLSPTSQSPSALIKAYPSGRIQVN